MFDHLVLATDDLEATVGWLDHALGVRPGAGGAHPNLGTRNALLSFGDRSYLEVIGPDPEQTIAPQVFDIVPGMAPVLRTWAVATGDIEATLAAAAAEGLAFEDPIPMRRERPDGVTLRWTLAPPVDDHNGTVPFILDWADSPHPARAAPPGVAVHDLQVGHPEPHVLRRWLLALGSDLEPVAASAPTLACRLVGPAGSVHLGAHSTTGRS